MTLRLASHYIDSTGKQAFPGAFRAGHAFSEAFAPVVRADGRMALLDRRGEWLGAPHDLIGPFLDGIARINDGGTRANGRFVGGEWSLIDGHGELRMPPHPCDALLNAGEGRASVLHGKRWGLLDTRGQEIVPPTYNFLSVFSEGVAVAATDAGDVYIDVDAKVVLPGPYQEATDFKDGLARVKVGGLWGLIDRSGAFVHPPAFTKIGNVVEGAAWAIREGRCLVLNKAGVLASDFDDVQMAKHGGVWPVKRGAVWSLLFPDGRLVGEYDKVSAVDNGFAMANLGGKWGFLGADGAPVVEHRYSDLRTFVEGHASAKVDGRGWALLRENGTELPGSFDDVGVFGDGLCAVRQGGRWGYIDTAGVLRVAPSFVHAERFHHGFASVQAPEIEEIKVFVPKPAVQVVPQGSLTHPVYEGCGKDSRLHCIVGFSRPLTGPESILVELILTAWERAFAPVFMGRDIGRWLSVVVTQLEQPVHALSLLLESLEASLPVAEVVTSRWEHPEGHPVAGPVADPASRTVAMQPTFDTFESYWDSAWSSSGPAPVPESHAYLKGALFDRNRKLVLEQRGMPVWFPDVRVCFGALSGNGEEYLPADEVGEQVWAALRESIEHRFSALGGQGPAPLPAIRSGEDGIERVSYRGKTGYAFAIGSEALLHWHAPSACRYREPELLEAIREVIVARGLAPVLMWRRFQQQLPGMPMGTPTVLVVNIWHH